LVAGDLIRVHGLTSGLETGSAMSDLPFHTSSALSAVCEIEAARRNVERSRHPSIAEVS
jgi:predicted outer membrane protein